MDELLRAGFAALGLPLDAAALARFQTYYTLLDERSKVMNLTAIHGETDVAQLHFLDCIALLNAVDFREKRVIDAISPDKDVDGMTPESAAAVFTGQGRGFAPCTAQACMALLHHYGIAPCGRHAVVIGRSPVVGRPVSMLLLRENATVTVCHTKTPDTAALTRQADIIITAAGAVNSLTAAHVRPGQTVLDVSMNWNGTALCGDADFPAVSSIVEAITPVPGGVGSVTSAVLMAHTVRAAEYLTGEGGA